MSRGRVWIVAGAAIVVLSGLSGPALAETGAAGWLRYAPLSNAARAQYASLPATIVMVGDSPVLRTLPNKCAAA
jgi:alpha-glucuronidase